jgi:hypothetical protein
MFANVGVNDLCMHFLGRDNECCNLQDDYLSIAFQNGSLDEQSQPHLLWWLILCANLTGTEYSGSILGVTVEAFLGKI